MYVISGERYPSWTLLVVTWSKGKLFFKGRTFFFSWGTPTGSETPRMPIIFGRVRGFSSSSPCSSTVRNGLRALFCDTVLLRSRATTLD